MITPFDASDRLDAREMGRIARYIVGEQRNDGVVVAGTTGESPTLSGEEKLAALECVLEAIGDRAAVVFGAGTYDTRESVHLAREGERRGAHGIMLVNPYYSRPGQKGLVAHFRTVARETSLPVMLYNILPRAAINLETDSLLELAEEPNIVAVKEASGNVGQISEVIRRVPSGFRVYSGDDGLTLPILALGGHGVVSVAGQVVGDRIRRMLDLFSSDPAGAAAIHHELAPAIRAVFSAPSPGPVKHILAGRGFDCGRLRLPLLALDGEEAEGVDRAMAAFGPSVVGAA